MTNAAIDEITASIPKAMAAVHSGVSYESISSYTQRIRIEIARLLQMIVKIAKNIKIANTHFARKPFYRIHGTFVHILTTYIISVNGELCIRNFKA